MEPENEPLEEEKITVRTTCWYILPQAQEQNAVDSADWQQNPEAIAYRNEYWVKYYAVL